ncbi:MAG: hypothetical protein A2Z42_03630 [Candidatus Woykebacteria bacterium RBG_19FT_COMBO_43_10]|uniref:Uncharacterized protein n=1 Tax=Candidatus Woykebacteria bacterium RBG_19FT_COMBO_43_10 TaxID=1802598 RepID=A0A1G1WHY9_9BACT|nr:MAG: hypothetical protein A2Z42_03630 [Candidatus Woykebacteria bacterium RBG_19FT_COMBO_43_10]
MPKTTLGKWSSGVLLLLIVIHFVPWANFLPSIRFLELGIKSIFALAVLIPGVISIARDKERAVLVYLAVVLGLLTLLFPLLFVLGEGLFPHD